MTMKCLYFVIFVFLGGECIAQYKNVEYSAYLSIGVNTPMSYKKNTGDLSFVDIGSATASNPGAEIGGVVYYRKIGFNLGLGYYKYEMDISNYQSDMQDYYQNENIKTYLSNSVKTIPVFAGLSYYFSLNNFCIEPRFLIRLDKTIAPLTADLYFWNNDNLERSIYYIKKSSFRLDYAPAISLSYYYPVSRELKIGIQMTYQYSFSNPRVEYSKQEMDVIKETATQSTEDVVIKYSASNFSFGFIVRFMKTR